MARVNPPLVGAADAGDECKVRAMLVAMEADGGEVDAPGMKGNTAVHRAARHGHVGVLEALLEAGADPNAYNAKRQLPLHVAAFYEHASAVSALLACKRTDATLVDGKGRTPAQDTRSEAIKALFH